MKDSIPVADWCVKEGENNKIDVELENTLQLFNCMCNPNYFTSAAITSSYKTCGFTPVYPMDVARLTNPALHCG